MKGNYLCINKVLNLYIRFTKEVKNCNGEARSLQQKGSRNPFPVMLMEDPESLTWTSNITLRITTTNKVTLPTILEIGKSIHIGYMVYLCNDDSLVLPLIYVSTVDGLLHDIRPEDHASLVE